MLCYPQASYNLTGVGLAPVNATTRKRIQTALRKTLGNGVNATLLEVGSAGSPPADSSSSADSSSTDATSVDAAPAASPDATIAGMASFLHFVFPLINAATSLMMQAVWSRFSRLQAGAPL